MARGADRGIVLAVVLAGLAAAPRAGGDDGESGSRRAAAAAAAAARLSAFGNWCRGRSYRALAREQFEEAIRLDPEDAVARAGLGHRKEEAGWKVPEGRPAFLDSPTTSATSATLLEREGTAAWTGAGGEFAGYARWCEETKRTAEARAAWERVLRFDPGHAGARTALGLEGTDAGWTRPSEEGPAAVEARFRKAAEEGLRRFTEARSKDPGVRVTEAGSGWSESREGRFSARSVSSVLQAPALLDDMVEAESLWSGTGVLDPRRGGEAPFRIVAAGSKEDYVALVDSFPGLAEAEKAPLRKLGGCWLAPGLLYGWSWEAEWLHDIAVHDTTHFLLDQRVPWRLQPWIYEGAGVLASSLIRGQARMFCVALDESAFPRADLAVLDWNAEARKLVQRGEDPPIGNMMAAGTNDLGFPFLVKARSMVAWMAARSPAAFRAVLAGSAKGAVPEEILRKAFGAPSDAIERRWRYWVRRP